MEEQLGGKDLHAIYSDCFNVAKKWYNFGLALGLLPDELDKISSAHRDDPDTCLRETLKIFLSKSTPKPTRQALICGLHQRTVGYQQLASESETKYKAINPTGEQARPNEHHRTVKQAMEQRHQAQLETVKKKKQAMEEEHYRMKQAMEERHLSDRQAQAHQHSLQLRAMEDEHHTVKQAMEQRHQAQLESKVSELSAKDDLISSKSSTIRSLQTKLGHALGTSSSKDNLSVFSPGVKLVFTESANVPETVADLDQGVVIGGDVYVGVTRKKRVFKYCIAEDSWSTLPLAPVKYARIGYLNKKVLIIGGWLPSDQVTADIHEFDEASQQWVGSTSIPPMPTARTSATVVSLSSPPALIVCGGRDQQHKPMTVVEVYNSRTSQWHTLSPLPFPRDGMSHTVIGNMLYLIGGAETMLCTGKKTVMSTSIPRLVDSCLQPSRIQWQNLSIPMSQTTCRLLLLWEDACW